MPVIRSTSVPPYASGENSFLINWVKAPRGELGEVAEVPPICAWPQAIMMAPARKFICLSMPSS